MFLLSRQIPTKKNKDNYKKYKNLNLSNQRKAERNYYREQFDLHKTDLKNHGTLSKTYLVKRIIDITMFRIIPRAIDTFDKFVNLSGNRPRQAETSQSHTNIQSRR